MKLISRHISYLLLTCRKVEVAGLGVFSAHCQQASFNTFDGIFYPSRIRISFSKSTASDDSYDSHLLLDSLKRKLKIDESEAQELISKFVTGINKNLKQNKYCRLEGIGYLIEKGKNIFELKDTFWKNHRDFTVNSIRV